MTKKDGDRLRARKQRLSVVEHHRLTGSEVVRVDVDYDRESPFFIVVEHLSSQDSIVIDFVYPDGTRTRHEHLRLTQN